MLKNVDGNQLKIYIQFIIMALKGGNCDAFVKDNIKDIKHVSFSLNNIYPVKGGTIYRGILLEDKYVKNGFECNSGLTDRGRALLRYDRGIEQKNVKYFEQLSHIAYTSYSCDRFVAEDFADTESDMSSIFMAVNPLAKGYIMEEQINHEDSEKVLFHYKWLNILLEYEYIKYKISRELDLDLIQFQQEVILESSTDMQIIELYKSPIFKESCLTGENSVILNSELEARTFTKWLKKMGSSSPIDRDCRRNIGVSYDKKVLNKDGTINYNKSSFFTALQMSSETFVAIEYEDAKIR